MGKEKIILTGDRPTGRLHIGHYVGSLKRRVDLQDAGDYSKMFIFIADSQALTDNMLEQAREIVRRFNYIYGETLVEPEILLPDNAACLRLPGTDGKAKMSKSLGNCIYLSEEPEEIQKKIMSMYTDPGHLRVQDPGKIEGNTVFTYLDAFCRPEHFERYLPDYPNLDELKAHYQRGGLGDVKVKRFLNAIMQETLEPIRNRRKEFSKDIPAVYEMLQKGCEVARAAAAETLADVKKAMKINYFDDKELIEEQVKRFAASQE